MSTVDPEINWAWDCCQGPARWMMRENASRFNQFPDPNKTKHRILRTLIFNTKNMFIHHPHPMEYKFHALSTSFATCLLVWSPCLQGIPQRHRAGSSVIFSQPDTHESSILDAILAKVRSLGTSGNHLYTVNVCMRAKQMNQINTCTHFTLAHVNFLKASASMRTRDGLDMMTAVLMTTPRMPGW